LEIYGDGAFARLPELAGRDFELHREEIVLSFREQVSTREGHCARG
jgi:hypothetical protein